MEKDMTMYSIILKFFCVGKHGITKRTVLFATMAAMICTIFPACNNNERIIRTDKFNGYPVSLVYNNEDKVYKLICKSNNRGGNDNISAAYLNKAGVKE